MQYALNRMIQRLISNSCISFDLLYRVVRIDIFQYLSHPKKEIFKDVFKKNYARKGENNCGIIYYFCFLLC